MKRSSSITQLYLSIAVLLLASMLAPGSFAQAQSGARAAAAPPPVLNIFREEVKAGRSAAHESLETGYVQAMAQAKWPAYWLGMTAASGTNEAWYITGYASFAALEKDRQDVEKTPALQHQLDQLDQRDAEFRTGQRAMIAAFRPNLSYHPERLMPGLPKARYFSVLTVRVRPGRDPEFVQWVALYLAAMEKANAETTSVAYQVISGAPGGTYLLFSPLKSLAEMDAGPANQRAIFQALGAEDGQKVLKALSETVLTMENTLFAFSPKMSYVSKEFASADPGFWTPKPKMVARPAAAPKKQAPKVSGN